MKIIETNNFYNEYLLTLSLEINVRDLAPRLLYNRTTEKNKYRAKQILRQKDRNKIFANLFVSTF